MERNKELQMNEDGRLHYQIRNLQLETGQMQNKMLGLQRRI